MLRKKIENFGAVFEPAAIDETRRHLTRREFAQMRSLVRFEAARGIGDLNRRRQSARIAVAEKIDDKRSVARSPRRRGVPAPEAAAIRIAFGSDKLARELESVAEVDRERDVGGRHPLEQPELGLIFHIADGHSADAAATARQLLAVSRVEADTLDAERVAPH